jgi:hypothetical protein
MVNHSAAGGDGGVGLPGLPVRVVREVLGEDNSEQGHHGIEDRPPTAVPAGPAITAKHADHKRPRDRRALAYCAPGVGNVCHAALCARSITAHQPRNDCGDDLGIVVSVGHKSIEQQDHARCELLAPRSFAVADAGQRSAAVRWSCSESVALLYSRCTTSGPAGEAMSLEHPIFRPDISQVGADRASVMRYRRWLLVAVGCCCCCQPLVRFPVSEVSCCRLPWQHCWQ